MSETAGDIGKMSFEDAMGALEGVVGWRRLSKKSARSPQGQTAPLRAPIQSRFPEMNEGAAPANFEAALAQAAARTQAALETLLPAEGASRVGDAMRYGALGGGKRLRGFLVIEGARIFRVPSKQADRAAAAIECLHAYSLIHDDLPCMDDDDLRRGRPTLHKVWDEAVAVLAGDALQSLAFEILAGVGTHPDPAIRIKLMAMLAQAGGVAGMVGGQDDDLAAEAAAKALSLDEISDLQDKKTGALIRWASMAGPLMGKSDATPLKQYATNIGLAFQIQDDILDVTGDAKLAGKAVGKDAAAGKATFVGQLKECARYIVARKH